MKNFPLELIPSNDDARLHALAPYRSLLVRPDVVFDEFTALVARLFDAPVTMLSFVDADSVWLKSLYGLSEPRRVDRNQSLCSVTILSNTTTVFEDLQNATLPPPVNDLLNEALQLRFYAGHPLQTAQGYNIGVLGIAGRTARTFGEVQSQQLRSLAVLAMQLLQIRLPLTHCKDKPASVWTLLYDKLTQHLVYLEQSFPHAPAQPEVVDQLIIQLQHEINSLRAAEPYFVAR